jgi:cold shock CspA family protein
MKRKIDENKNSYIAPPNYDQPIYRDQAEHTSELDEDSPQAQMDSLIVNYMPNGQPIYQSYVAILKEGYGFINFPGSNLYFYHADVINKGFNLLSEGQIVQFIIAKSKINPDKDAAYKVEIIK